MSPERRLILLADDDERFRERLSKALLERGYGIFTAASHGAALAVARVSATRTGPAMSHP